MIDAEVLPTIPAARVRLRWLEESDVPALFRVFSHEEVMRYWSSLPMQSADEAAALLAHIRRCFDEKSLFQWGVVLHETNEVIGTCTLAQLDSRNRRADLGYALARDHWGRGLMLEALCALFDFGFGELNLHRLEADVDPRNEASLRLLERLGFTREGFLRERWLIGGGVQDTVLLGLLHHEWRARRAEA